MLTPFNQDGVEIYIDHETGESFASVNGYSRMSGKALSTISERINGVRYQHYKMAEVLTSAGLKTIRLISEDLIAEWLPKDNPAIATQLMKLGVRLFIHKMVGYSHQESDLIPKLPANYLEALKALVSSEEEKQVLAIANQKLESNNAELAPKAAAADVLLEVGDNLTFQEAAQLLGVPGIGRNNLFKALVEMKLIIDTQHPYQKYVEQGIFVVRESLTPFGAFNQILVTQKGVQYLIPKLEEYNARPAKPILKSKTIKNVVKKDNNLLDLFKRLEREVASNQ